MVKKIPKEFKKGRYKYTLLKMKKDMAIYEQIGDFGKEGVVVAYEIHKVRLKPPCSRKIKQSDGTFTTFDKPKREVLAASCEFGEYGWHFQNKDYAYKFFDNMVKGMSIDESWKEAIK